MPGRRSDQLGLDDLFADVADEKFTKKLGLSSDLEDNYYWLRQEYEPSEVTTNVKDEDYVEKDLATDKSGDQGNGLPYSRARCIALVITVCGSSFTDTFSIQAVVILLPSIGRELGIPDSRLQWIMSSYALAFGCFLIFWGRIADVYSRRNIFICGTSWLALMTLLSLFVYNEIGFDVIRGLQGLGAAANVPAALGILGTTFRPGKAKTYAFAAYGAGAPLGSIFGNILAGVISAYLSWRWVFGVMALLSASIAMAGVFIIPIPESLPQKQHVKTADMVDWVGAILVTTGLFLLLFALTEVNIVGWSTFWIPILIITAFFLIALFITWQIRLERRSNISSSRRPPLIKVSMFRSSGFSAAMLIMALFSSSFNGFLVYATYFYQSYQGLDVLQTTLRFIPTGVVGIIASIAVAFALDRVPTWMVLFFGNSCVALASLLYAVPINPDTTSYFAYGMEAMSLAVLGSDSTWPSITLFTSESLSQEDQALGGALVSAMGQVGRSMGLAVATAAQVAAMAAHRGVSVQDAGPITVKDAASLAGVRAGAWFNFGVGACSVVVIAVAFRGTGIIGKARTVDAKLPEKQDVS